MKQRFSIFLALLFGGIPVGLADGAENRALESGDSKGRAVLIETRFIEISPEIIEETGFDWLLGLGGASDPDPPGSAGPKKKKKSARNQRLIATQSSYDFQTGPPPANGGKPGVLDGVRIAGIFTDPQFQFVIEALADKAGVEMLAAPKVRTRSGRRAAIQIVRGALPKPSGTDEEISPAKESESEGVHLVVTPEIGPDGYTIDLELVLEVIEFEGFIREGITHHGTLAESAGKNEAAGKDSSPGRPVHTIEMPVFATRKDTVGVTIWDGQVVALSGLVRKDTVAVENRVPVLGSIPLLGPVFRSQKDFTEERRVVIFVSAKMVDDALAAK